MKIVRRTQIHPKLEAVVGKCEMTIPGMCPRGYYFVGYVAAVGEPDGFFMKLAHSISKGKHEIYSPAELNFVNGPISTKEKEWGYLGFDTAHSSLFMRSINEDEDPYKIIGLEVERLAEEFLDRAKEFNFKSEVIDLIDTVKD